MLDFPLKLQVELPVVDRIHPQSKKFATGVENKAPGDSKLNDSPVREGSLLCVSPSPFARLINPLQASPLMYVAQGHACSLDITKSQLLPYFWLKESLSLTEISLRSEIIWRCTGQKSLLRLIIFFSYCTSMLLIQANDEVIYDVTMSSTLNNNSYHTSSQPVTSNKRH